MKLRKKLLALVLTVMTASAQMMTVSADLRSDLAQTQEEQAQTSSELSEAKGEINDLEDKKNEITGEIDALDADLIVTMAAIDSLNNAIADKQAEIEVTEGNLAAAEQDQEDQYQLMKKRIEFLYETGGDGSWMSLILNGSNIADMLNQVEYTQKLYSYDRQCLEDYMAVVQQVTDYKNQLTAEKAELEENEAEQEVQQASLEEMLDEKRATCSDYEAQLEVLNEKASEYASIIAEQNEKIQEIQAEIAAEEEAARKAAEEAAARAEAERQRQAAAAAAAAEAAAAAQQNSSYDYSEDSESSYDDGNSYVEESYYDDGSSYAEESYYDDDSSYYEEESSYESQDSYYEEEESSASSVSYSGSGEAVASYACNFVGNPYVWGGESLTNGCDCSGFIMKVYESFGVYLPHSSASMRSCGVGVSYSEAQPGDIICYDGHVALYLGGGAIVHAADESLGIIISSNAAYRTILAVRRVI